MSHSIISDPNDFLQVISLIKDSPDLYKTLGFLNHASDFPCPLCHVNISVIAQRALTQAIDAHPEAQDGPDHEEFFTIPRHPVLSDEESYDSDKCHRGTAKRLKSSAEAVPATFVYE